MHNRLRLARAYRPDDPRSDLSRLRGSLRADIPATRARPLVRHGLMALQRERRFLVLGADAEFGRRLHAGLQPRDQFVARLQRRHIDLVTRHTNSG